MQASPNPLGLDKACRAGWQSAQALDCLQRHSLPKVKLVDRTLCSQRWLLRQLNHHAWKVVQSAQELFSQHQWLQLRRTRVVQARFKLAPHLQV